MYPMVKAIMLDYSMKSAIICLQSRREKADSHIRLQFHLIQLQRVVRVVVFGELLENPRLIPKLIPVRFQEQRQTRTARSEYGEPSLGIRGDGRLDGRLRLHGAKHQGRGSQRMNQPHVIGVISDTHGLLRPEAVEALQSFWI